jgi:hypothetical protein
MFIATKDLSGAGLYRAPRRLVPEGEGVNRLRRVGGVPSFVTDGAFLGSGRYVLRTYGSVYLYSGRHEQLVREPLPPQPQGESIAAGEGRLLVGSEGERSAVYAVPIPRVEGEASGPVSGESDRSRPAAEDEWRELGQVARAAAIAVALVVLLSLIWRRSRRR